MLAVLSGVNSATIDYNDFVSNSEPADGTSGNDVLIGTSSGDNLVGGGGNDVVLGWGGDDTIAIGGNSGASFTTRVDGGAGTDRLNINYSGITSLGSFASLGYSGSTLTFTDAQGGVINATGIETLYVNDKRYVLYLDSYSFDVGSPGYGTKLIWGVDG